MVLVSFTVILAAATSLKKAGRRTCYYVSSLCRHRFQFLQLVFWLSSVVYESGDWVFCWIQSFDVVGVYRSGRDATPFHCHAWRLWRLSYSGPSALRQTAVPLQVSRLPTHLRWRSLRKLYLTLVEGLASDAFGQCQNIMLCFVWVVPRPDSHR